MAKNLVIVESPTKARTIGNYLGKDFLVKSCNGHVRDLYEKELSIDIDKGFLPKYEIPAGKKKLVTELRQQSQKADTVWLATDEDREGEAISWHLMEALKVDGGKTRRIAFHEITKTAILEAISNPRSLDRNLVDAQQARRVLDRLVGYELSPVLWRKVKPALSAGRVQSVAVRLIVEREEEIKKFVSESSFRTTGVFEAVTAKDAELMEAELSRRFRTKEEALAFLGLCKTARFTIGAVEKKPAKKSPAPPFTTSTLQQEASRKLGFPVSKTMQVAQQLYESGLITYMRTDSVNLSSLALGVAKKVVAGIYGPEYVKTRQYTTRSKSAQEAHEAIRPTYIENQSIEGDAAQRRLYELIWKRTIASQMSDALLEKTVINIIISNSDDIFVTRGEVIQFDGFLKVYLESSDEEEKTDGEGLLPALKVGDEVMRKSVAATERFTQSPPRYTEASLVKKLEELGIGRPSTYAPTISTIQKREYVTRQDREGAERSYTMLELTDSTITESVKTEKYGFEKGKLFPTDIGNIVNQFLVQYFENILDYNFTASVEQEFDEIARGNKAWNEMIKAFYGPFHNQVVETLEKSKKQSGEKLLGKDPASGKNVYAKIGRFGPIIQIGDTNGTEKPRFAGMRKDQTIESIGLEEALELFRLPRTLGQYEDKEVVVATGKYGPYLKHNEHNYSLGRQDDPYGITLERAIEIIREKIDKPPLPRKLGEHEGGEVTIGIGRFGPYIKYQSQYFAFRRPDDPYTLTLERALEIMQEKKTRDQNTLIKAFDEQNIRIMKGRFGYYLYHNKKNYKLPEGADPATLTAGECLDIIKNTSPKKKRKTKK